MKKERYRAKNDLLWLTIVAVAVIAWAGDLIHRPFNEILISGGLLSAMLLIVILSNSTTYLEIQDMRTLVINGYRELGKDSINLFDIIFIGRTKNFPLKQYGSRMVFYIKMPDGSLVHSSQREINFSNKTLIKFLKRIKQLNPRIVLDHEYESMLKGELLSSDSSQNKMEEIDKKAEGILSRG
jgi:hypothetical protein